MKQATSWARRIELSGVCPKRACYLCKTLSRGDSWCLENPLWSIPSISDYILQWNGWLMYFGEKLVELVPPCILGKFYSPFTIQYIAQGKFDTVFLAPQVFYWKTIKQNFYRYWRPTKLTRSPGVVRDSSIANCCVIVLCFCTWLRHKLCVLWLATLLLME